MKDDKMPCTMQIESKKEQIERLFQGEMKENKDLRRKKMTSEDQAVSLELSKKLKEAGYSHPGSFWWVDVFEPLDPIYKADEPKECWQLHHIGWFLNNQEVYHPIGAPTIAELTEQLPATIAKERHLQILKRNNNEGSHFFRVDYGQGYEGFSDASLANALAKMWLWLMEVEGEDLR
uniref:Uncharacterized protein n=1 Tax=viral metagenome TaxID=1070528 RepID=A0A6M3L2F2_9ZZZZ